MLGVRVRFFYSTSSQKRTIRLWLSVCRQLCTQLRLRLGLSVAKVCLPSRALRQFYSRFAMVLFSSFRWVDSLLIVMLIGFISYILSSSNHIGICLRTRRMMKRVRKRCWVSGEPLYGLEFSQFLWLFYQIYLLMLSRFVVYSCTAGLIFLQGAATDLGIGKLFIGTIIIPIVGNAGGFVLFPSLF